MIDEFIEVAQRPKFKKYFSLPELERLLLQIKEEAEFIEVTSHKLNFAVTPKTISYYHWQKMAKRHTYLQVTKTYSTSKFLVKQRL